MKTCTKCNILKELTEFNKRTQNKDGLEYYCKPCIKERNKIYRDKNKEIYRQNSLRGYNKHKEQRQIKNRKYYREHILDKKAYDIVYRETNKEKITQYKKDWEYKNKNNPIYKIRKNLRRRVHHLVKRGDKSLTTFKLIGCNSEEFKKHIESQFLEGMSWDNYSTKTWHIDHIIPCYTFDLTNEEEQRKCFHYTNQRPLWAKDNLSRKKMED